MITLGKGSDLTSNEPIELYGKSTDTKPTKISDLNSSLADKLIPNGSSFVEMNTSKVYLFDGETGEWREF